MERVLILKWTIRLTLSVSFDGQFEDGLSVSDSLCTAASSPHKKSEKGCLWGRGRLCTGQSQTDNATIREFSTFKKINRSRGTISFTVNSFLHYLRLTVKIFQFLQLSTNFWAVLHLSVNPIKCWSCGRITQKVYLNQLNWPEKV